MKWKYPLLTPNMPTHEHLKPWLSEIDDNKYYSNRGPLLQQFESELLFKLSPSNEFHLTTTKSCTSAIELTLNAYNIANKGYILTPAFTYVATAIAIVRAGCKPLFADVDLESWQLTPEIAELVIKQYPIAAVIPVATYGAPCDINAWQSFFERTGIPVIIDAAGAITHQPLATDLTTVFSLHATKVIAAGEGGIVVSSNRELIAEVKERANYGLRGGLVTTLGGNEKLSEYHAAVGLASLQQFDNFVQQNLQIRNLYHAAFSEMENIRLQSASNQFASNLFSVRFMNDVHDAEAKLSAKGIMSKPYYLPPLYEHPLFQSALVSSAMANTRKLAKQLLCLPFSVTMSDEDIRYVSDSIFNLSICLQE